MRSARAQLWWVASTWRPTLMSDTWQSSAACSSWHLARTRSGAGCSEGEVAGRQAGRRHRRTRGGFPDLCCQAPQFIGAHFSPKLAQLALSSCNNFFSVHWAGPGPPGGLRSWRGDSGQPAAAAPLVTAPPCPDTRLTVLVHCPVGNQHCPLARSNPLPIRHTDRLHRPKFTLAAPCGGLSTQHGDGARSDQGSQVVQGRQTVVTPSELQAGVWLRAPCRPDSSSVGALQWR